MDMKNRLILLAALMVVCACSSSKSALNTVPAAKDVPVSGQVAPAAQFAFVGVECDIENVGTRKFLEEVDYSSDPDYTLSFAREYRSEYGANDKPLPVKITWSGGPVAKLLLSSSPQFDDAREVQVEASQAIIYNLIPGVRYYFRIQDAGGNVLKSDSFVPEGPMRMINGVVGNMRDLGGWEAEGGHIAYGKLYRGSALERISESGKKIFLEDLGISVDLDLRGYKESEYHLGAVIDGIDYLKLPLEKNLGRGTGRTEELYQQALRAIIGWLGEGRSVYFHCAGGADRTGSLAFLIEALLGVSESDLSKDYELTTFGRSNTRLRNFRATEQETHILYELVTYLRTFGDPADTSINELVLRWVTTRHSPTVDPITPSEIALLRQYLIVRD